MQSSKNQKTVKFIDDIGYHLESLKVATSRLQLDYNTEEAIYYFCENSMKRLEIIEQLSKNKKLQLPLSISQKVNLLFDEDKNLSVVNCQIINTKRVFNPTAIGHLKIIL